MLGDWKILLVSFELKEGTKPYHGRPYPIPKIHKATLMKKIDHLVSIGIMKWKPSLQWPPPSFIVPTKDHTVLAISDFMVLNKWIVRKPYPLPKISTTLQELEGFTYAFNPGFKHGLLFHQVGPNSFQDLRYYVSVGQTLLNFEHY